MEENQWLVQVQLLKQQEALQPPLRILVLIFWL